MNTKPSPHPVMIIAAIAVVLFCSIGTAAIMGWIPNSLGETAPRLDPAVAANSTSPVPPAPLAPAVPEDHARAAPAYPAVPPNVAQAEPAAASCKSCGHIESIREVSHRAEGSGLGAAGGAIIGGILGHQLGGGHGRDLATAAGAVGGAVVGNQVEGNAKAYKSYEVRVRLDDGTLRTFNFRNPVSWQSGQRVKVVNGAIHSV